MSTPTITYGSTFGLRLYAYYSAAYTEFGGLVDGTPPILEAGAEIDMTCHGSPSGVEEKIWDGISRWTAASFKFRQDVTSGAVTDPAMLYILTVIGSTVKFKLTRAGITAPRYFNAIVKSVVIGDQPVSGPAELTLNLVPTGVAPSS
jgi:hypothetical protein